MYIFLTLYTKTSEHRILTELTKRKKGGQIMRKSQTTGIKHYYISCSFSFYTGHAYNVSIHRCIILILHSIFKSNEWSGEPKECVAGRVEA